MSTPDVSINWIPQPLQSIPSPLPWPWQEVKKRQLSKFKIVHVLLIMLVFCISHVFVFLIVERYRKDTKTPCREEVEGMIVTSPFSVRRGVYTKSVRFQRVCINYMIVMT
jgi:hypothetical protein